MLIDGAGISGTESICRHGVAWYASRLGGSLLGLLSLVRDRSLSALLAEAIEQVTDDHRDTCDVADPISPSATIAILRLSDGLIEHLVLGDSVLVLDRADSAPLVVSDPREVIISGSYRSALEAAAESSEEYHRVLRDLRANRNQPGGFWVAKDDPRAADEAITGSCPTSGLTGAVLLSNGASRIVDLFRLADWPEVMLVDPQPHVGRQPGNGIVACGRAELAAGDEFLAPSGEQLLDLGFAGRDAQLRFHRGPWSVHLVQRALDDTAGEVVQFDLVPQFKELEEHRQCPRPAGPG
ncbi:hypothetical protein [Streptomyces sp. NBC_00846]|uniref:hypothetical protein n=1 Tax=Streptomyces sp. NBC_00846 TaxID=2975849 RepID=UPI003869C419